MALKLSLSGHKSATISDGPISARDIQDILRAAATRAGVVVNEKTALQTAAAFCAGRVIAEGVAQLPVKVYRNEKRGDDWHKIEAREHWSWNLLRNRPNDWMTGFEFRETMTLHAMFAGNGYAVINRGAGTGAIMELLPVLPGNMRIKQNEDYSLTYTASDAKGVIGTFAREQVLHLRGPSWNGYQGLPAIKLAREALGLSDALQNSAARLQKKGGQPSGILTAKEPLSLEAKSRLKKSWDERYGPDGDAGIAVLDGLFEFTSTMMTGVDAQHIESRRFQIEEVARFFRVFPQMLMQADKSSTYASAEQFFLAHVIHSLDPWLVRTEQTYQRDILQGEDDHHVECIRDGLLRGASKDRAEQFAKALGAGGSPAWMTPNEVRRRENLNPIEGGDELPKPIAMTGNEATDEFEDANNNAD